MDLMKVRKGGPGGVSLDFCYEQELIIEAINLA